MIYVRVSSSVFTFSYDVRSRTQSTLVILTIKMTAVDRIHSWSGGFRDFAGLLCFHNVHVIVGTYYSYSKYYELKGQNVTATIGLDQLFTTNFNYYLSLKQTWLAFGMKIYLRYFTGIVLFSAGLYKCISFMT